MNAVPAQANVALPALCRKACAECGARHVLAGYSLEKVNLWQAVGDNAGYFDPWLGFLPNIFVVAKDTRRYFKACHTDNGGRYFQVCSPASPQEKLNWSLLTGRIACFQCDRCGKWSICVPASPEGILIGGLIKHYQVCLRGLSRQSRRQLVTMIGSQKIRERHPQFWADFTEYKRPILSGPGLAQWRPSSKSRIAVWHMKLLGILQTTPRSYVSGYNPQDGVRPKRGGLSGKAGRNPSLRPIQLQLR